MNSYSKYFLLIFFMTLFVPYGCIQKQTSPAGTKQSTHTKNTYNPTKEQATKMKSIKQIYYIHVVRWGGESLSMISKWYLGNYKDWKLLAKHNPELNPDNIHVGDRVWIPKKSMKTSQQMPEPIQKHDQKQKKKIKMKKSLELYGPKDHEEKTEHYSDD